MRLRIIKHVQGEIDGVSLDQFHVGETYDIGTTLGSYLLAVRAAVPVSDHAPVTRVDPARRRSKAADGGRAKRKPRRKIP